MSGPTWDTNKEIWPELRRWYAKQYLEHSQELHIFKRFAGPPSPPPTLGQRIRRFLAEAGRQIHLAWLVLRHGDIND